MAVTYLAACTVGTVVPLDKELARRGYGELYHISETAAVVGDEKHIDKIKSTADFMKI
jgi:hypothetical protein